MTQQALSPTDALGQFRLQRELGRGRLGVVYLAHDTQLDRPVALKLIDVDIAADGQFRTRFLGEMARVARLEHPNIVAVYGAGEIDGRLYVAMRYVDGEDLRALLRRSGSLGVRRVAQIGLQLGTALDAAHIRGVVHGSIKPSNVLLDTAAGDLSVYVCDFALALDPCAAGAPRDPGAVALASGYMAPEQAAGAPATVRSDVFAMGRLLFALLTGDAFAGAAHGGAASSARGGGAPARVASVGVVAGPHRARVDEVIAKACAEQPEDRYACAGDLARAFLAAIHGRSDSTEGGLGIGAALDGLPIGDEIITVRRRSDAARVTRSQAASRDERRAYPYVIEPQPVTATTAPSRHRPAMLLGFVALLGVIVATTLLLSWHTATTPKRAAGDSGAARRGALAGVLSLPALLRVPSPAAHRAATKAARALHPSTAADRSRPKAAAPRTPSCAAYAARCTHAGGQVLSWQTLAGVSQNATRAPAGTPGALATAVRCPSFSTHASDGSPIPVDGVTATNLGCHAARVVIDALPTGRLKTDWNCPLTGDPYFTTCTNTGNRTVAWHDPSGRSQDTPTSSTTASSASATATAGTGTGTGTGARAAGCGAFHTSDSKGVTYLATPQTLSGITCAAARALIAAGPAARANAGWSCPLTGDRALTACTRGDQQLTWAMNYSPPAA